MPSTPIGQPGEKTRDLGVMAVSLAGLVVFWAVLAQILHDPQVLAGPLAVWLVIVSEAASGTLFYHLGATLARVAAAFLLAMSVGTAIGITLGSLPRINRWLDPWVIFFLNLPALVVIVLCYLWIGLNEVAAIVAVAFNKTAMVIVTMREGVRAMDPRIADVGRVYRFGPWKRLRHLVLPQLAPFFSTGVRNGLAVIWKIVLVVEFLGRGNGVGFQIHLYFQQFDIAYVLAYSLSFVAIMLAIEYLLVQPWETRASHWRRGIS